MQGLTVCGMKVDKKNPPEGQVLNIIMEEKLRYRPFESDIKWRPKNMDFVGPLFLVGPRHFA